ncbi:hypothetical protein HPP92_002234 [Vanilla planifolia]|uniref:Uncharacterized protein n=1 Tax=Vanilla planifolia TaxID=51239 RepID=A0A835VHQ7_VANPL|nr:hypothetical protein HPP92_002234 [Vanilla planifolia]
MPVRGLPGHAAVRAGEAAVLPELRHLRHGGLHLWRLCRSVPELSDGPPPPARQPAEHSPRPRPDRSARDHWFCSPQMQDHRRRQARSGAGQDPELSRPTVEGVRKARHLGVGNCQRGARRRLPAVGRGIWAEDAFLRRVQQHRAWCELHRPGQVARCETFEEEDSGKVHSGEVHTGEQVDQHQESATIPVRYGLYKLIKQCPFLPLLHLLPFSPSSSSTHHGMIPEDKIKTLVLN